MILNESHTSEYGNDPEVSSYWDLWFTMANCAVLLTTVLVGITANVFVIWAMCHKRSLQTSNNALLANLALIDLLRCTVDCPLLLAILLQAHKLWDLGILFCQTQTVSFSFCCCVQLLTLACISGERYKAIAHPFQTSQQRRRIMLWIPFTWTASVIVASACAFLANDAPVYIQCRAGHIDLLSYDTFGLFVLVPVWFGCFFVISGFYWRIFRLVRAHNRKIFDGGVLPSPKKCATGDSSKMETAAQSDVQTPASHATAVSVSASFGNPPPLEKTADEEERVSSSLRPSGSLPPPSEAERTGENESDGRAEVAAADAIGTEAEPKESPGDQSGEVAGAVCMMPSFANRERANKSKESKLAKRSGCIILTFLLAWTPLIASVFWRLFIRGYQTSSSAEVVLQVEILSVCVACMTSASNPVTYAAVNPQFHSEYQKLRSKCQMGLCR